MYEQTCIDKALVTLKSSWRAEIFGILNWPITALALALLKEPEIN